MRGGATIRRLAAVVLMVATTLVAVEASPAAAQTTERHERPTLRTTDSLSVGARSGVPTFGYVYWVASPDVETYQIQFRLDGALIETKTMAGADAGRGQYVVFEGRAGRWCARVRAAGDATATASPWSPQVCSDITMPLTPHAIPSFETSELQIATAAGIPDQVYAYFQGRAEVARYEAEYTLDGDVTSNRFYAGGATRKITLHPIDGRQGRWCVRLRALENDAGATSPWSPSLCVEVSLPAQTTTTTSNPTTTTPTTAPPTTTASTTTTTRPRHERPTLIDAELRVQLLVGGIPRAVYLQWDGLADVGNYQVQFRLDGQLVASPTVTGNVDGRRIKLHVIDGQSGRWCARVRALGNAAGTTGPWSAQSCADVVVEPPAPTPHTKPAWDGSGLAVSPTSGTPTSLTATFAGRAEVGSYRLEFRRDGALQQTARPGGRSGVISQDLTLDGRGGRWCVRVRAEAESDGSRTASPWSDEVCRDVSMPPPADTTPPPSVQGRAGVFTHDSIAISWPGVADASGVNRYQVLVDGTVVAALNSSARSHVLEDLTPSTRYVVVIRAVDNAGNVGSGSYNIVTTRVRTDTDPPSTIVPDIADVSHDRIRVSWDPAIDDTAVTAYEVAINGTKTTLDASTLSHTFSGLRSDTNYQIVVRARDARANWGIGQMVPVRTDPPPGPPTIAIEDWNLHSITMTWTGVPEGTVALIPYLFGAPTSAYITDLTSNTHVFRNLQSYDVYQVSLVAVDADGVRLESNRIGRRTDFDDGTGTNTPPPGDDGQGPIWLGAGFGINVVETTASTATIDWTGAYDFGDDKNASSYGLYVNGTRIGTTDCGTLPAAECSPETSAVLSDLTPGVAHSVVVVANDIAGNPSGAVNGSTGVVLRKQVTPSGPASGYPGNPGGPPDDPDDPPPGGGGPGPGPAPRPTIGFTGPDDEAGPACPTEPELSITTRYWDAAKFTFNPTGAYDTIPDGTPAFYQNQGNRTTTDLVVRRAMALGDAIDGVTFENVMTTRSPQPGNTSSGVSGVVRGLNPWIPVTLVLVARDLSGNETFCSVLIFRVPEEELPTSGQPVCATEEREWAWDIDHACTTYYNRLGTDGLIHLDNIDQLVRGPDFETIGWTLGCVTFQYIPAIGDYIDVYCAVNDLSNVLLADGVTYNDLVHRRSSRCAVIRYDTARQPVYERVGRDIFGAGDYARTVLDWSADQPRGATRDLFGWGPPGVSPISDQRYNLEHFNPICDASPSAPGILEPEDYLLQEFCPNHPDKRFEIAGDVVDCANHQG